MSWSPNSKILVAAFVDKHVLFWNLETGSIAWERLPEIPTMVSISPHTAQLALATEKMLLFGCIGDSAPTASHPGQQIVAWSPSNKLATLDKDDDATLVIWQAY
jgi:WD40 repeat protein